MLTFFVDPYEEEMISSLFARYHFYSGNSDKVDTLEELLGEREIRAFKIFPSKLKYLESQMDNPNYTSNYFIYKHTLFPLYSVFLSRNKHREVIDYMEEHKNGRIHLILGIAMSKVDIRNGYKYCPLCVEDDIHRYGEAYFHRLHQMQGVLVCDKHGCKLYDYTDIYNASREFVRLKYDNISINKPTFYEKSINDNLIIVAKIAKYILNTEYLKFSREDIIERIRKFLERRGYLSETGRVRQNKLIKDLNKYYNKKLLELLNSKIDSKSTSAWTRLIFQERMEMVHPIRYILLIWFLVNNNINEFFSEMEEKAPFGEGPWPCLNPICEKYNKRVIKNIEIVRAPRSRLPNGIFKCKFCDYTYRRKGPDKLDSDIYKRDKILNHGQMWNDEFAKCIERGDTKASIKKRMGTYLGFIDYYIEHRQFKSNVKCQIEKKHNNFDEYTNNIKEYMQINPYSDRAEISKEMRKQIKWLRNNNPEWLDKNLPKPIKRRKYAEKVNYKKIDLEIRKNIEIIYKELIALEKPRRITLSLIEKLAKTNINKRLDKLPKTKIYLDSVLESVDEFRVRRVQVYCDKSIREKEYKTRSKILLDTTIPFYRLSCENAKEINSIIEKYHHDIISNE